MREIVFFSNNKNKIYEISELFRDSPIEILNLDNFKKIKSPKETGDSFEENSRIKSLCGLKHFNKICFADDSGICIDALNGKPGVNSKEYLEEDGDKNKVLKKIIDIAKEKNNYSAYFQTKICLAINKDKFFFFDGKIKGEISKKIIGLGGFGYDPIFIPKGKAETFAQMSMKEKNSLSHRSIAIKKLKDFVLKLI